jgi:hypothetical protein
MTDEIYKTLSRLPEIDVSAARDIRDESDLPRRTYHTTDDQNTDSVTALFAGGSVIIVTDRFETPDSAWMDSRGKAGLLDQLVDEGALIKERNPDD